MLKSGAPLILKKIISFCGHIWNQTNFLSKLQNLINPFAPNAPFLYPLKTENRKVFWCFQGVEKECIWNSWVQRWIQNPAKYLEWRGHPLTTYAKFSEKTDISNPLIRIRTRMCAYQGVRNDTFSENFVYVLSGWPRSFLLNS